MRAMVAALFVVAAFVGCARHSSTEPSASPQLNNRADCEAAGGKWKALTHHCDRD